MGEIWWITENITGRSSALSSQGRGRNLPPTLSPTEVRPAKEARTTFMSGMVLFISNT